MGGFMQRNQIVMYTLYLQAKSTSRYCQCLFSEERPDIQLDYDTPLQLALDAIKHFQPCQLADAPHSLAGNSLSLEDEYLEEFYCCLFPLPDGHVAMSPESVIKTGPKGGTIDFLVAQKKRGLELLRDRDWLQQHIERFEPNRQYFTMIKEGKMDQYIVLDFANKLPQKARPGFKGRLYHVAFSENYRKVGVIDASDLSEVDSFVLMEKTNSME
ncbi:hypothetical protein BBP40_009192 [Aspergillus hancockii]|nr:hypothetical protein BBP40_009192 [Aspergillus hancockii]